MRLHFLAFRCGTGCRLNQFWRHVPIPVGDQTSGRRFRFQADLYGGGHRALLLAHGGRFNKESWQKQAPVFARAGFLVLAINYRGDIQSRWIPQRARHRR